MAGKISKKQLQAIRLNYFKNSQRSKAVEPVKVKFKTRDGRTVEFKAKKNITKPVKVKFKREN